MEIILAIVVASAVILFGALISMGNERQRKAIDSLREQVVLWAMQDLRIKRERLARNVQVSDPLVWLNKMTIKVCGLDLNLQMTEIFDLPQALMCISGGSNSKILFSPISPNEIKHIKREKISRLSQYAHRNPIMTLPKNVISYELSVLNCGFLFDLELPIAWYGLTSQKVEQMERLWIYIIP